MRLNDEGFIQPFFPLSYDILEETPNLLKVCPFYNSDLNENEIGKHLYGNNYVTIDHDDAIGYYLSIYAGHIKEDRIRLNSSSGGFGSWISKKMLESNLVDQIIHVKPSENDKLIFSYHISDSENLRNGSKSRYYPIEMSKVLDFVTKNDHRYLFIGLPCFVKALRLLQEEHPLLKERIKFTMGLVCGHLKSDFFARAIAWEVGVHHKVLDSIDFRTKSKNHLASNYSYTVQSKKDANAITFEARDSFVSNWGHGQFKYKACDYCDDVFAETADIVIGDAWLEGYINDWKGNNIILTRDYRIEQLLTHNKDELEIDEITLKDAINSQRGGLEHRRVGLAYRLFLAEEKNKWYPIKRVEPSNKIPKKRRRIYDSRILIQSLSLEYFREALLENNFLEYTKKMRPILSNYDKLYVSHIRRVAIY
jgi:coenzyme F420-reducing hydrogenase beta subunit